MKKHSENESSSILDRARPLIEQHSIEIQPYGTIAKLPIALAESTCKASVENLNQLLADTITLRDMYKKHHWQVAGPTFSLAMAHDVAETTIIPRLPRGRQEVPVQISRLLHGHEVILLESRSMAKQAAEIGDDGTNDLLVSEVIRTNELQVWFLSEHVVPEPLVHATKRAE
jgi:starvation-inducible DNA-binding protein